MHFGVSLLVPFCSLFFSVVAVLLRRSQVAYLHWQQPGQDGRLIFRPSNYLSWNLFLALPMEFYYSMMMSARLPLEIGECTAQSKLFWLFKSVCITNDSIYLSNSRPSCDMSKLVLISGVMLIVFVAIFWYRCYNELALFLISISYFPKISLTSVDL